MNWCLVLYLFAVAVCYVQGYTSQGTYTNQYSNTYGYNTGNSPSINQGYSSGYGPSYNQGYNAGYGPSYNQGFNGGYSANYNNGYGNNYGYGQNYHSGYGSNYGYKASNNKGYGYSGNYGAGYANNFYNTFPYFFLDPFGVGYNSFGFQNQYTTGFPWSPFGQSPWSSGYGYYPFGYNMYGIHPHLHYNGHFGVYKNYGYGNKFVRGLPHPVPVPVPFWGHQGQFFFQRRPSLGERIMNSPLLPAALIAAPLILLAKGK